MQTKDTQDTIHNRSLLCDQCWKTPFSFSAFQKALLPPDDPEEGFQGFSYTTQTWKEIEYGENHGCNWCDFLWGDILEYRKCRRDQSLRTEETPQEDERWAVIMKFSRRKEPPHHMTLSTYIGEDMFPTTYEVYTSQDDNAASIVPGRSVIWKVASPECFQLALDCLNDCTTTHSCPKPTSSPLPTRVVDCSDPQKPKLFSSLGLEAPYTALSYVWGQAQPHSTSSTNINTYLSDGIDIEALPQTIRDAISCTYSLGSRYLWTDTLCIIQDSPEDKNHEISQMCNIYNNAHFTIIAACAKKANDGFLHDRPKQATMELPFWCPDGQLGTISVQEQMYAPRNEPVSQRAWCFQERLLSPRTLIYASHTLQYHCQAGTKNVGNANNFSVIDGTDKLRVPDPTPKSTLPMTAKEQWKIWREWKSILANYTRCSLTCPTDKLVALSGVAQFFERCWGQQSSKTKYLAGLWKHTFSQDVLWYRPNASARNPPAVKYRAPSWSWAATDGPIAGPGWPDIVEATWTVRRCEVFPATPDLPFGELIDAILEVDAVLRRVSFEVAEEGSSDVALYEVDTEALESLERSVASRSGKAIGFAYMDTDEPLEGNIGYALVVGSMNKKVLHHLVGLLLVPIANVGATVKASPRYRRVGLFDVHEEIKDEPDEPFCDMNNWLKMPTQVITIV